jgi:hypothetical protein
MYFSLVFTDTSFTVQPARNLTKQGGWGMKRTTLLVVLMSCGAAPAWAGSRGEVQLSALLGAQNLRVDDPSVVGEDRVHDDGLLVGAALAYRLPGGLLFEGAILHSGYSDFLFSDLFEQSFDTYQYSVAVGWQFDRRRWRLTPKVGLARSKLTSSGPLLFPPADVRPELFANVPFVEGTAVRRLGDHFALGLLLRETFEDFGHTRSVSGTLQYFFD